jgi:hypothetical protein
VNLAIASRELLDLPPSADVEAERMVLGSVLTSATPGETFTKINEHLQPRDFHDPANRVIFEGPSGFSVGLPESSGFGQPCRPTEEFLRR